MINYLQKTTSAFNFVENDAIQSLKNVAYLPQQIQSDLVKFTYFVENEKMLSSKALFVDAQREEFVKILKELKRLLSEFIRNSEI